MKKHIVFWLLHSVAATLFLPLSATAQSAQKQTPARSVDVKKVFGYYDLYLRLPPQDRDGFRMVYTVRGRERNAPPQMNYALNNIRTPIQMAPNGRVLTLPDLTMYNNGKVEIAAGQPSASVGLDLEPIIALSSSISAADATNPINDYKAAIRRAGPMSLVAPKLDAIVFKGGSGGQAVFADGRRVALPSVAGGVRFQPSASNLRGVVSISFTTPPTGADFSK